MEEEGFLLSGMCDIVSCVVCVESEGEENGLIMMMGFLGGGAWAIFDGG